MMIVQMEAEYAKIFEDLQADVADVLRQHAIKELELRLSKAKQTIQAWEEKYGCAYETFIKRTTTDELYIQGLNDHEETQLWEGDLISWEFDVLELQTWPHHLQKLLTI